MMSTTQPTLGLQLLLLASLFLAGGPVRAQTLDVCGYLVTAPFLPAQFDEDIQPIFDGLCVDCHRPGGQGFAEHQLDLRPGFAYRNLVGRPSRQSPWWLVRPFHPEGPDLSYLLVKVICDQPPFGARMPPGTARLSALEVRTLYAWILRGAPPGVEGTGQLRAIEVGHSGAWFDPSMPGHGFSFEVLPGQPSRLIAFWMTFDLQGAQRWLVGSGEFEAGASSVALTIFDARGGVFDFPLIDVRVEAVGTAELTFASCVEGWLRYDIRLDEDPEAERFERTIVLRRLAPSPLCDAGTDSSEGSER